MSTPVKEQIAEDIKAAVNQVTVDNGFNQTLNAVRPRRIDFANNTWADLTVLINQVEAEEIAPATFAKEWRQFFVLTAFVIDKDSETNSIDTRLNQVSCDIEKKLMEDSTRSGLAIDTAIHEATPFEDDSGKLSGVAIKISVHYRTKDNDPYTRV